MFDGEPPLPDAEPHLPGDLPPSRRASGPVPPPVAGPAGAARSEWVRVSRWRQLSTYYIPIGVAGGVAFFFLMGALNYYSIPFILQNLPSGIGPCETSLEFTTYTFVIGLGLAMGLGMVRAHPPKREKGPRRKKARGRFSYLWRWPLYAFATGFVQAIRGTPFLVQLYIVFFAVTLSYPTFTYFGWDQFYWCGFIALLINTTGYQTEAIRGGIQAVEAGQIDGAKAVGLGKFQTFFRVTMPQTLRLVTLPLTNEWISNFKTATILSYISIIELYYWSSTNIALTDARPIEAFVLLSIFYLFINVTLSRAMTYVEKTRRIPGLGSLQPEIGMSRRLFGTRGGPGPVAPGPTPGSPQPSEATNSA
ncbi:MAG: amino acid ABC transporter permease [Thermoplasmata archaeon]